MKNFNTLFLSTLGLGLLVSQAAQAQQSVGNGATPARTGTMLDVNGPLATAETAVAATGTTAPAATITTVTGQARLTTGTATAGPITVSYSSPANVGQRLMIYNSTALAATFNSQDIAAGQAVEFVYSDSGWRATAGGGNITATNGLTKTGNAIGLGGTLTSPTTVAGLSATNPLVFSGTAGASFTNTTAPVGANATSRALALQGGYNGGVTPGVGGTHLSFLEGGNNEVGRVASVQENGAFNIGLGFSTTNGTIGTVTERLRISAAGNVGIGTIAPTQPLDVAGNARVRGLTTAGIVTTDANGNLNSASAASLDATTATNGLTKTGNAIGLGGTLTGATAINQNGNNFGFTGGSVGIGTTGPIQRLDVASGGLRVGSNNTISGQGAYLQWNRTGADGETWLLNQSGLGGGSIRFGVSDAVNSGANTIAEWARFDAVGNLGIGTPTPGQKLDVNGNSQVSGSSYVAGRVGIGNTTPYAKLEISGGARGEDGSGGDVAMAFSTSPSTGYSPLRHYIRTRHSAAVGSGFGGNSIDFYLNNSGNNPNASSGPGVGNIHAVTFDNFSNEARVGIGTIAPTQTLDVVGNARIRGLSAGGIVTADANGNLGLASGAAIDATTASNGLSKNGIDVQLGGVLTRPTAVSGISAANPLNFVGASDAEAAVTVGTATGNSGRVSLGNANHGLMRNLTGSTGGLANDVALYTTDGGGGGRLFLSSSSTISGSTNLPLGQFTLVPSGYVGLGTANPTNKLHIVSSGGPGFADDDFVFDSYTSGGPGTYYRHARGTVAAPANLVAGDGIHIQGDVGFIGGSFQQTAFLNTYYTGNGTTNLSYMQFGTSGAERLRIAENGNVGIGTPAPNSRLSLTPTATEAKITLFDGGSTTAHYGFGISSNQLNYDVTSGASHVFYVNSKNGSGSEVLRTNAAGTYIQTAGGPQLAITTTRGAVGTAVPANADGNVYYEVVGLENHVFGGNVVPNGDNNLSLGLSSARWSAVYTTNGVVQTSDSRLKTHIENSGYGLQAVLKLRPVTYNWKSQPTTNHMVGFLAQELEQVVPEAVVAPKAAGEYYGVKYEELIPVLTKAIQEQQAQIESLKTANTKLQAQASSATQTQAELQDVKASLLTLAEQVKQLQAGGATATTK